MTILSKSKKQSFVLVTFEYGAVGSRTQVRYTDWSEDVKHPISEETHTSLPEMEVEIAPYTGGLKEKASTIQVANSTDFLERLSNGEPFATVDVKIEEVYQDADGDIGILVLFVGMLERTVLHYQGKKNTIYMELESVKSQMDFPLGLPVMHQCTHALGDEYCGVSVTTETATVVSVGSKTLELSGLSAHANRYWHRGYVEYDGLRINIRDWESGTTFYMSKAVPADWAGQTVTVSPGCDKTVETCRSTWANEGNFNGPGYAMPGYLPLIERP